MMNRVSGAYRRKTIMLGLAPGCILGLRVLTPAAQPLHLSADLDKDGIRVEYVAQAGDYYQFHLSEASPEGPFRPIDMQLGGAGVQSWTDPRSTLSGVSLGFIRASARPASDPGDADGDGVDDVEELNRGRDPLASDAIYVSPAGSHESPFMTPDTAATNLQAAIDQAHNGAIILVGAGTYTESNIEINKDLRIQGVRANCTIVQAAEEPGTASERVFLIGALQANVTLANLSIRHGKSENGEDGGGILSRGTLTLNDCFLTDNRTSLNSFSSGHGGGIYVDHGRLTMNKCVLVGNQTGSGGYASGNGGGICVNRGAITMTHCVLRGNRTGDAGTFSGDGGGILSDCADIALNDSRVSCNRTGDADFSSGSGAGIYMGRRALTMTRSIIAANRTGDAGMFSGDGGGIYNDRAEMALDESRVSGNSTGKPQSLAGEGADIFTESGAKSRDSMSVSVGVTGPRSRRYDGVTIVQDAHDPTAAWWGHP